MDFTLQTLQKGCEVENTESELIMEENQVANATGKTVENTAAESENVTMTRNEFDKKLQGEADRVRTEYSKKVKELEAKVKELTPVQKSEAEIDLENRLAALEAKEKRMALLESLSAAGISHEFSAYLKNDVDIEAFGKAYKSAVDSEVQKKVKLSGYIPNGHKSGESITKEDFAKMNMTEKEQLYTENPELYRVLSGR